MLIDLTYENVRKNIDSMRALGLTRETVYLRDERENYPWHLATRFEAGGSHRMDIDTSGRFYATDPVLGVTMSWSFEIEPWSANGKGHYELDVDGIAAVIDLITGAAREQFLVYLKDCRDKVKAKGDEWFEIAAKQHAYANRLNSFCRE